MRFLHTADWQIGKSFQAVEEPSKREALRKQRVDTVRGLREVVRRERLEFVVVCGDLFDSATPDKATVSALCSAVGALAVPVYAIPGNHDHSAPGCIWEQDFFQREQQQLAPNLHLLLQQQPLVTDNCVILPCPLQRRHLTGDPTAWLRTAPPGLPDDRPCIVLAHGSTQGFSSAGDEDGTTGINEINLKLLPESSYDYIALGDWHGMKRITDKAWFSGSPEQDRFAKGDSNQPGHVLVVEVDRRGAAPEVTPFHCGVIGWHTLGPFAINGDADLPSLQSELDGLLTGKVGNDILKLSVTGSLTLEGGNRFDELIETLQARLIRLVLESDLTIEPSTDELDALSQRQDPLIVRVAHELREDSTNPLAADALRELYSLTMKAGQ